MKPFRFRLQRLMHLREAERRQRVIELVQEQRALDAKERAVSQALDAEQHLRNTYRSLGSRRARADIWLGAQQSLIRQRGVVAERIGHVRKAVESVERARERVVEKSREFETLERLRRRKLNEYALELRRDEAKENDAKAVERFVQARREHGGD